MISKFEQKQHFRSFKQQLLESVYGFTDNFTELKAELEDALVHIDKELKKEVEQ